MLHKNDRLLRTADFRRIYQNGSRISTPYFAAFCLADSTKGARLVGFTLPRKLGKAVKRNRMKRRMREAVRMELGSLPAGWSIVFNPRPAVLDASFGDLESAVEKVFLRCSGPS